MIMIITLTLSILVIINFLLLKFSCNKTTKRTSSIQKPSTVTQDNPILTKKLPTAQSSQLAPTGS